MLLDAASTQIFSVQNTALAYLPEGLWILDLLGSG